MKNEIRKEKKDKMVSSREKYSLFRLMFKGNSKAGGLCLAESACSHFIGLSRTLRVCGKQCCFTSLHGQSKKVQEVLRTLAVQESDNKSILLSSPLDHNNQSVAHIPLIPSAQPTENPQHFDGLSCSNFSSLPATLINSKKHRLFKANFSSLSSIPEGSLFRL
jgi:hypothetical protein